LTAGAIVPHAPLLLDEVAGPKVRASVHQTVQAVTQIDLADPDLVVIISPHGPSTGVYASPAGSLAGFGRPQARLDASSDPDLVRRVAEDWRQPVLESEADHGVVVPISLLGPGEMPVLACTLRDEGPIPEVRREAEALASIVRDLADSRRVAFVASLNASTALSPRAPLMERSEGIALDAAILDGLSRDGAQRWVPDEMWSSGGSCGAGPFAAWMLLCAGLPLEEISYESPFGVGYLVAVARGE
jgi:hypothetical protein